jgi:hypothetical protein
MMQGYRTSYSRALFKNANNGFNARYLDADDWDFIESVRQHGCVGYRLGAVQGRSEHGGAYSGYWCEADAIEAYALQAASDNLRALNETNKPKYFSVDEDAAKLESENAKREREQEQIDKALKHARREAVFARAAKEHAEQLAELERVNHEETVKFNIRELQTAEIEFDWAVIGAKIARDRMIAEASRDRRERQRALKAAERELQQATKFLRRMQKKVKEHDQGHPGYSGQNEQGSGTDRGQDNLGVGGQAADQRLPDDAGLVEGGHRGSASGASESSVDDDRSRSDGAAAGAQGVISDPVV